MLCGSVSGIGSCLSGFTLDTLKVKMQVGNCRMLTCLKDTIATQGLRGLYKGVYYPLLTGPLVNAMNFGVYQLYKNFKETNELSFKMGLEAGAFSGLVGAFVVSPVEMVKCKMQTMGTGRLTSSECLKEILRNKGLAGLYQGMVATILREIPSIAAQFAAYEYLKNFFLHKNNSKEMSIQQTAVAGGLAGMLCWLVSYPQDVIKTKIQLQEMSGISCRKSISSLDGGLTECVREIWGESGMKGFWKGLQPCLIRAFIANAVGFYIYENMQKVSRAY